MAVAQRMTVEEYLQATADQRFTQLIAGEVVVTDPLALHQDVMTDVLLALRSWTRAAAGRGQALPSIDTEVDDHNCFSPDVGWYRSGREPGRSEARPQPLPDVAVEVRSPSTWRYDIGVKKDRYEEHGVAELWLVDTAADVVLVFRRSSGRAPSFDVSLELGHGETLTSPLLPGFALALDELFPRPAGA